MAPRTQYEMVPRSSQEEYGIKLSAEEASDEFHRSSRRRRRFWRVLLIGACLLVFLGLAYKLASQPLGSIAGGGPPEYSSSSCGEQRLRREWRTLTDDEKSQYIKAVQCTATLPSTILENATVYDEFPYVHALKSEKNEIKHGMPLFLPFHRYLLSIYEKTLNERCGYNGTLPYWDWTLDWTDMPGSPVFDPDTGFGGDGDPDGEVVVDHGRCVTEGPFATLRPLYRQTKHHPHCLSRGFRHGAKSGRLFPGNDIRPQRINPILTKETYDDFNKALEMGPHNIIPFSIRGDMFSFSSPYEPLFFLHHAQLDRLWWIWQQRGPQRTLEYGVNGTLDHELDMHGLGPNVRIHQIMSTNSDLLCYRYF